LAASMLRLMFARLVGVSEVRFVRPGGVGRLERRAEAASGEGVEGFMVVFADDRIVLEQVRCSESEGRTGTGIAGAQMRRRCL
jgi:hypothetical protein